MSARLDAVEVARDVLEDALGKPVSLSMADSYRRPEATVLTCGMPVPGKRYWDGSGTVTLRLTVIVKRMCEEEAIADADDASRAINKAGALESRDGSYRLVSNSAETPRQLRWDEQGRWVWAFDAEIEYEER